MYRRLCFVLCLVGCFFLNNIAMAAELKDPAPISVPKGATLEQLSKAINGAMIETGWKKDDKALVEAEGVVQAAYYIRAHKIFMLIKYDLTQINFSYFDSVNMKFKEKKGKRTIHGNYMVWTQTLADKIAANVKLGEAYEVGEADTDSAAYGVNPLPKEAFSNFKNFKLMDVTLAPEFAGHEGNVSTQKNLMHGLKTHLLPVFGAWAAGKEATGGRTLVIEPHIQAVKFIGTGARIFVGGLAGRSWIYVRLLAKDEATGAVVAEAEFYRVAAIGNGFSGARPDYQMVEDMAYDLAFYVKNNYATSVGGGVMPPNNVKAKYGPK